MIDFLKFVIPLLVFALGIYIVIFFTLEFL